MGPGSKDLIICFPKKVNSYETGHCYALKNSLRHRLYTPWILVHPVLQGLQGR